MSNSVQRRRFLHVLGASAATFGTAAVSAGAVGGCGGGEGSGDQGPGVDGTAGTGTGVGGSGSVMGPPGYIHCGNVASVPEGALIGLRFEEVIIARDEQGLYAMTSICTHKQCNMLADGGILPGGILCGCHDSEFDADGQVDKGPAKQALDHFSVVLDDDGNIFVDRGQIVDPDTRVTVPE